MVLLGNLHKLVKKSGIPSTLDITPSLKELHGGQEDSEDERGEEYQRNNNTPLDRSPSFMGGERKPKGPHFTDFGKIL